MRGLVVTLHEGSVATEQVLWHRRLPASVGFYPIKGRQIPRQRNMGVAEARRVGVDWCLMLDSDTVPRDETLDLLLSRDAPIVTALVLERSFPFNPAAVKGLEPPEKWRLQDLPVGGVVNVVAAGAACLLIRRAVWEGMDFPWFRCGQIVPDLLTEDTEFCLRAAEAGFGTVLDCDARVGHKMGNDGGVLWPGRDGTPYVQWPGASDVREPLPRREVMI